ncbi:hypothetical protein DPX16_2165 [Anabarilius grahami]|uniref:Ig-like domain-containing protein n=1 Tax=Anabarilius grahami TaxID=495550 RepID=A0A3N0YEX4_ANAGA|nr:hypothetical protein DPX16_2165 [Anabarilius grahami]
MADQCDLCLLGLIILSSLLTGTTAAKATRVFISSGENVPLSCNNHLSDCESTRWSYDRHSAAVKLIDRGIKKKDTERHERLSLGSDCSLNIKNVTEEDYGFYTCRQYVNGEQQGTDAHVYLHVLHGRSVTLSCQLYSYSGSPCDYWVRSEGLQLLWVNQAGVDLKTDSRYQILFSSDHCIITLTTTLLNEDDNREWRCQLTLRNQLQTSVRYTVKYSVIVMIVEMAVFAAPTVILLQIICARRAVEVSVTRSQEAFGILCAVMGYQESSRIQEAVPDPGFAP